MRPLLIGLLGYWFIGLFSPAVWARNGSDNGYKLEVTKLDPNSSNSQETNNKAVVMDAEPIEPFTFSISQTLIDFGQLLPTNPVVRSNMLTVSNEPTHGYFVVGFEDHPLSSGSDGPIIPDTTCDNGTCAKLTGASWTSPLTYGFGYRCDNLEESFDCSDGFYQDSFYKQFADVSKEEPPAIILESPNPSKNQVREHQAIRRGEIKKAKIIYKVNVSGSQPIRTYGNTIVYIAIPSF